MQESAGAFQFDTTTVASAPAPAPAPAPRAAVEAPQSPSPESQLSLSDLEELLCQIEVDEGFMQTYEAQYGEHHPRFELGSVRRAMKRAQESGKPLLLYLHYPDHVHTLPFCW